MFPTDTPSFDRPPAHILRNGECGYRIRQQLKLASLTARAYKRSTVEKRYSANEQYSESNTAGATDARKAYEAPKVLIKRSVAHATLATVPNSVGPQGTMLTSSG